MLDERLVTKDRRRKKDAHLARLMGMPVLCFHGYYDPEGNGFCINMPKFPEPMPDLPKIRSSLRRGERLEHPEYIAWRNRKDAWREMSDAEPVEWDINAHNKDDSRWDIMEFCTPNQNFPNSGHRQNWEQHDDDYTWWEQVLNYCIDHSAIRNVEDYIFNLGQNWFDQYIVNLGTITGAKAGQAFHVFYEKAWRATPEQQVDAAIQLLEKKD